MSPLSPQFNPAELDYWEVEECAGIIKTHHVRAFPDKVGINVGEDILILKVYI